MKRSSIFAILFCVSFAISGSFAPSSFGAEPSQFKRTDPRNYRLAPDDLVEIKVFQEEDLTTRARISRDGIITFPLIGNIKVGAKTVQEVEQIVRRQLSERFLVRPEVTVSVIEYTRRLFTVIGQVQRPGTYKFPDRESLDLVQAIGVAGGYSRTANAAAITVKRTANGKETVIKLNGKKMAKDSAVELFYIQAGDIITVNERLF